MDFFLRRMALKMTALALGSIDQDFVTGQYILHSPDMKKNVHMNETVLDSLYFNKSEEIMWFMRNIDKLRSTEKARRTTE